MIFRPTPLDGAWLIELERHEDERGHFARTYCRREFAAHGLDTEIAQSSLSFNSRRGTLRGMHFQEAPHEEAKLVRCVAGSAHDVIIDLRSDSPTYRRHFATELIADGAMLYVPRGFAHGFLTLADATTLCYQISAFYEPRAGRGVRWNDPAFGIDWPFEPEVISERDRSYPDFEPAAATGHDAP